MSSLILTAVKNSISEGSPFYSLSLRLVKAKIIDHAVDSGMLDPSVFLVWTGEAVSGGVYPSSQGPLLPGCLFVSLSQGTKVSLSSASPEGLALAHPRLLGGHSVSTEAQPCSFAACDRASAR